MRIPIPPLAAALGVVVAAGLLSSVPGRAGAVEDAAATSTRAPVVQRLSTSERQVARVREPRLKWARCPGADYLPPSLRKRVQCARPKVPLDYDRPRGATTRLGVVRLKAAKPGRRIGSLFVNPGGPGGSAADFVLSAASALGPRVAARFDIIGVDPRGVGGSGLTACSGKVGFPPKLAAYPLNYKQAKGRIRYDDRIRRACAQRRSPLVDHASTADVARDMDLIRRAVGDAKLSYYGISYGSYLGATYAAMFPHKIRALVVDGVLDPVSWSTGDRPRATRPFTTRLKSGYGAYESLTAAWTECDRVGPKRCPLAPNALGKWKRVLGAAKSGRLRIDGQRLAYQDVVGFGLSALYDRRSIPYFAGFVADLSTELSAARTGQRTVAATPRFYDKMVRLRRQLERRGLYAAPSLRPAARRPATTDVLFSAVTCSDSRNPADPFAWHRTARVDDRRTPWFGRLWTWSSSQCARRGIGSHDDAFMGPWRTRTSYPLLVVGNSHDPATPINGARRVNQLFADSVLALYNAWGHGALGGGPCITGLMANYLVQRKLPADGTVCRQPQPLFR